MDLSKLVHSCFGLKVIKSEKAKSNHVSLYTIVGKQIER